MATWAKPSLCLAPIAGQRYTASSEATACMQGTCGKWCQHIGRAIQTWLLQVHLKPAETIVFVPHASHDLLEYSSLRQFTKQVSQQGYYGGIRLLMVHLHDSTLHCQNATAHYLWGDWSCFPSGNVQTFCRVLSKETDRAVPQRLRSAI